jgi:hypothetical protein
MPHFFLSSTNEVVGNGPKTPRTVVASILPSRKEPRRKRGLKGFIGEIR